MDQSAMRDNTSDPLEEFSPAHSAAPESGHGDIDEETAVDEEDDKDDKDQSTVPFVIPKNVAPLNEVHEMIRVSYVEGNKSAKDTLVKALFLVISAQACNKITVENSPDRMIPLYDLATSEFTNTSKKSEA